MKEYGELLFLSVLLEDMRYDMVFSMFFSMLSRVHPSFAS